MIPTLPKPSKTELTRFITVRVTGHSFLRAYTNSFNIHSTFFFSPCHPKRRFLDPISCKAPRLLFRESGVLRLREETVISETVGTELEQLMRSQ